MCERITCYVWIGSQSPLDTDMTDNQQSGMQSTQTIDMCHFLIDLLTLSNEAGQEQIQLL